MALLISNSYKMWAIKLFGAVVLIAVVVADSPTTVYPERPGYCRIKNVYIKEGEQGPAPLGECSRITCQSAEPGKVTTGLIGCGTFVPAQDCHVSDYDYTKQYPDCCPQSVCSEHTKIYHALNV